MSLAEVLIMKKGLVGKIVLLITAIFIVCLVLTACELSAPAEASKYFINDNEENSVNKDHTTKDEAIDQVTNGIENLRSYLDSADMKDTGYYMGVEFNIDTIDPNTLQGSNFRLKIQAHLYTYPYLDEDGNLIYKWFNEKDGKYYDEPDPEGTYIKTSAEDIHNDVIRKSDILVEWYNGATNTMLIGMYFDGLNSNSLDPGNILYLNIQGYKRSFYDFGDTVLYQQLVRLLMSLSVEKLLTAGNLQGDAGTSSIRSLFEIAVNENYKVVENSPLTSVLFYGIAADAVAGTLTDFIQNIFKPFENKLDPFMLKYLGFKFSVVGNAIINSVASDMQFFTEPDPSGTKEIMTGAFLTFDGAALSNNTIYNYVSDVTFEYGTYPPEDMTLDRDHYLKYDYGKYEFEGNLYIPMLNANYDALIRTDMHPEDGTGTVNKTNNVYMEYRDIANGELMIGAYYRHERTWIDISGLEYLYGWIDLNELGFPKVYDESINLAELLRSLFDTINDGIVSIVDGILSPDKNDKESHLLEKIMAKMSMTEKDPDDIFSINSETLIVDVQLVKDFLYETGKGTYTTRDIINILDSMLPYTMDQIAIMLGVANAEIMLDNSYFRLTLNVDTNEIRIEMLTNVGRDPEEGSLLIFQLDLIPVKIGEEVNIATVNFDGFKPLEQIYTYSATMNGNFIFSTAETVDLSKLLSATIGENSGLNTPYRLPTNAGVTFRLIYDQFVTDHIEKDGDGNMIVHKAGRSAFQLQMYLTGGDENTDVIIRLASDDVAFNSDVYNDQPARAGELGYVWVSIECVKDNNVQRVPKVKIREDVFMNSMQAYLDGTSISDDAAELGKSEVNLSITSILFALVEDSYVVMQPEQMEITSSNETLQNIFRVKGLIGNIRVDAGFRQRVEGLQNIKKDYGLYQVGQFTNIVGNNPYDTELHDEVPIHFYEDYLSDYPAYVAKYLRQQKDNETNEDYIGYLTTVGLKLSDLENITSEIYYKEMSTGRFVLATTAEEDIERTIKKSDIPLTYEEVLSGTYETYRNSERNTVAVEYLFLGWDTPYEMRVDKKYGHQQVYYYGAKITVRRQPIEYAAGSFFNDEDDNNQDISKTRFILGELKFVFLSEKDGLYHYFNYAGEEVVISNDYVRVESGVVYIYYHGVSDMLYHAGGAEFFYYDSEKIVEKDGLPVYLYTSTNKDFLFEYQQKSIEITEAGKSQYAPRINGSFMGTIRRYFLTFTTQTRLELGKIVDLNAKDYYNEEDENNKVAVYDDKGILVREDPAPIVLYVMEPCLPLAEEVAVNLLLGSLPERYDLPAKFDIDWDSVTLKGTMVVTEVTIAPGMMGEKVFPVRIIVTNREIDTMDTVTVFTEATDSPISNVPVVDVIEIDPYDYIIAKNNFFLDPVNYNPDLYSAEGENPQYLQEYYKAEREFVNQYFEGYQFNISFKYTESNLYKDKVEDKYIATSYNNKEESYVWNFDQYSGGSYTEDKISAVATGGQTYTALYLHTYFKGQLVALQVNVGQRILSHIKFSPDDTFDPAEVNGDKEPGDKGYIYGHYVANYFDEDSYTLPVNPIFVFTDGANHYYEKVFDMPYIEGLANNGNYFIDESYSLTWGDEKITNIGSKGSYYYEDVGGESTLVNRPFYGSNVVEDEDGNSTVEPIPTSNASDVTSTSINWFNMFAVYKPIRESGTYTGRYLTIPLIAGDANYSGFMTTVIRVSVECPKLNVAEGTDNQGNLIVEADDFDKDENGNKVTFTPSAIDTGSAIGYYLIDPLDKDTLTMPSSVIINFVDDEKTMTSKHRFNNVQWFADYDEQNNPSLYNDDGVEVLRKEGEEYIFNLSTEEASTTKVRAIIGSKVSGYEEVILCIRVLSKDPQEVEFFVGDMPYGENMTDIERTDINYKHTDTAGKSVILYTYYVNTFADFKMPSYIIAYFGTNKDRSEYYVVDWKRADGRQNVTYTPDSICDMIATIGTGEVNIDIYLSVVVANHEIKDITLADTISGMKVKVGDPRNPTYSLVGDLLQTDFVNNEIGLYGYDEYGTEQFVVISMGEGDPLDVATYVPAGMIGLYDENNVLRGTLYPYQFINQVYSSFDITFEAGKAVTIDDITTLGIAVKNEFSADPTTFGLANVVTAVYSYDVASGKDILDFVFQGTQDDIAYYPHVKDNGRISVYKNSGSGYVPYKELTIQELTFLVSRYVLSEDIDDREIDRIILSDADELVCAAGTNVKSIYGYAAGGVQFYRPGTDKEPMTFGSVLFKDGSTMTYNELKYRLNYYNAHRRDGYAVQSVSDRAVGIRNIEGIFSINDVVRTGYGETFRESDSYKIGLGTGAGSYDIGVRIVFDGGYRVTNSSDATVEIEVSPYGDSGRAQYGEKGYVFSDEVSIELYAVKRDGAGVEDTFRYGPDYEYLLVEQIDRLTRWYVEASDFLSIPKGTYINRIDQAVIYSQVEYGSITVSTLTKEGFRITRKMVLPGAPASLTNFNSTNDVNKLAIKEGTIVIDDVYEYLPMNGYFGNKNYLPDSIRVELNGKMVDIDNVNWKIDPSWYGATEIINGSVVGVGALDVMTYDGTYNRSSGTDDKRLMATAEILGWESVVDGVSQRNDSVKIQLYITIKSAEIVNLPWDTGNLKLDTTVIEKDGDRTYYVEADAFNDAGSSAMANGTFTLPRNLNVEYRSGITHTFSSVTYRYRNYEISEIPYDTRGVDVDAFVEMMRNEGVSILPSSVSREYVDVTVNVGLQQTLSLRIRFYDKTAESTSVVIDTDDPFIRGTISASMTELSSVKVEELYDSLNQTRIRVNIENIYDQANLVREKIVIPSADKFNSTLTIEQIKNVFSDGWIYDENGLPNLEIFFHEGVVDLTTTALTNVYSDQSVWNFVLANVKEYVLDEADATAAAIYNALHSSQSETIKRQNVEKLLSNYATTAFNGAYDYVIGEYVKIELSRVFVADMKKFDSADLTYASYYKNKLEASIDYNSLIREIYRIRELRAEGMYDDTLTEREMKALINRAMFDAIDEADEYFVERGGAFGSNDVASLVLREGIQRIFLFRIGAEGYDTKEIVNEMSGLDKIVTDITNFINIYALDDDKTKSELRYALRNMVGEAFDFSTVGYVATALSALIPEMVADNVASIQNFDITVQAIRRNLSAGVDISSMVDMLIERGVKNYVDDIYMESKIVREIKKVQSINMEAGSYYIDPYYGYVAVPSTVVVEFDEDKGGFAYETEVQWTNDSITGNVTYAGNAKNDVYGYVSMWTVLSEETDEEGNEIYTDASLYKRIDEEIETDEAVAGKTWSEIKSANMSIYNVLQILEGDGMLLTYFTADQLNNPAAEGYVGREGGAIELYKRYLKGKELLATDPTAVNASYPLEYSYVEKLFRNAKYTVLNATITNANTEEMQMLSLVTVVKDRTLSAGELRVLDDRNSQVTKVEVANPFEFSTRDLPNRIKVGEEYHEIVWNDVVINPLGNLSASSHTIYGNIKNASGQQVQLELYVYKWEYAGMTLSENIGTEENPVYTTLNPLNFYFSENLRYSAEDSYRVSFNIYNIVDGVETVVDFKTVEFYPQDSELLVNTTDDEGMREVLARKKYVIFWDEMALNSARNNVGISQSGELLLGNDSVGTHSLKSLTLGSVNNMVPKTANYFYENMTVHTTAFVADSFGLSGNTVAITAIDKFLPMTAKVNLNVNNVDYDPTKLEVRVLWNYNFETAVNRLIPFVAYSYPDVEEGMQRQYAINIIMNYDRSAEAQEEILARAITYYREVLMSDDTMTEKEIENAAKQLLMYEENFDFAANPAYLEGGAVIKSATLLIRYGDSDYIREVSVKARLIFGDYTPVTYYKVIGGGYPEEFDSISAEEGRPDRVFIGVINEYFDEGTGETYYETVGENPPYDNINTEIYKLLNGVFKVGEDSPSLDLVNSLRRILVSDIVYEEDAVDGYIVSKSFTIDGVRYESDLIKIKVA